MKKKELKQLAIDVSENKVFGTFNMIENNYNTNLPMVFMPLVFMNDKQRQNIIDKETAHIYEYMDQAGYRSVNGMPTFFTMKCICEKDWVKVVKYIKEYEIKVKSFLDKKDVKPEGPTLFDIGDKK